MSLSLSHVAVGPSGSNMCETILLGRRAVPAARGSAPACRRAEACCWAAQEFDASRNMLKANIKEFLLLSTAKRLELNNNALSGVLPPDFTTISGIVGALLSTWCMAA